MNPSISLSDGQACARHRSVMGELRRKHEPLVGMLVRPTQIHDNSEGKNSRCIPASTTASPLGQLCSNNDATAGAGEGA